LFTILRNTYLHRVRADQQQRCVSLEDIGELPDLPPEPLPEIDPDRLQQVLNELPEVFRTPILLYYFEDFSYPRHCRTDGSAPGHGHVAVGTRQGLPPLPALSAGPRRGGRWPSEGDRWIVKPPVSFSTLPVPIAPSCIRAKPERWRATLAGCPECDSLARVERQLDDHVGRAVRNVPVPEGLRDRLLQRLKARRRAWYASRATPLAGLAAAAAAVLFVVWLNWPHALRPRPRPGADWLRDRR